MTRHSIQQTFTVYQNIAILPTKTHDWSPDRAIDRVFTISIITVFFTKLFTEFLTISSDNCIFYRIGGQFFQIGLPVRISPGQFYIGICLFETVPD